MPKPHRSLLLLLVLTLTACGYGLVGRTSSLPPDIHRIFIRPLKNSTLRQLVEQELTRAISDEFVRRRRFEVVNSEFEADAVLSGEVTDFRVRPVLFGTAEGRATEYEILIMARMEFVRTDNEEVLWKQDFYQFRKSYEFDIDQSTFFNREDVAITEVAGEFAQTLVIDVLEGF